MKSLTPIRWVAVIIVAVVALFSIYMTIWMTETLSGPGWCAKAIGADKAATDSKIDVAGSCVNLLTIQLKSLAINSHIFVGMFALILLVLIVVVVAGSKLHVKGGKEGFETDIGADAIPVQVTNAPSEPVPVAPTPPVGPKS